MRCDAKLLKNAISQAFMEELLVSIPSAFIYVDIHQIKETILLVFITEKYCLLGRYYMASRRDFHCYPFISLTTANTWYKLRPY